MGGTHDITRPDNHASILLSSDVTRRDPFRCRATPIAVVGGVTGSELDVITARSDPRKAPDVKTGGMFSTELCSGALHVCAPPLLLMVVDT